jgi:hypothetical protein
MPLALGNILGKCAMDTTGRCVSLSVSEEAKVDTCDHPYRLVTLATQERRGKKSFVAYKIHYANALGWDDNVTNGRDL